MNTGKLFALESLRIDSEYLSFRVNSKEYRFRLSEISSRLANASEKERNAYSVSPSGYGIHWEMLDEDLSIKSLIQRQ